MPNPLISEKLYSNTGSLQINEIMTLQGAINKSLFLVILTVLTSIGVWSYSDFFVPYLLPIILIGFSLAMVIIFVKKTSVYLSPVYAILEGLIIGTISSYYEQVFPGIVIQAVSLTFSVFLIMLILYKFKIIEVTEKFKTGVMVATGAIALVYIVDIILSFFGVNVPFIHEGGFIGIGVSFFIVGIASFNLILDFNNIEIGVQNRVPKYMEWYTSFGLLITLIWLYLEILRLLAKIRD